MEKALSRQGRQESYWSVLCAAVELEYKRGHLKWTMSELSRKSGVTRSLIYYRFGRSKIAILQEVIRTMSDEIVGTTPDRLKAWQRGDWLESVRRTRAIRLHAPYLANFYLAHRGRPNELGRMFLEAEMRFLKKLETHFPGLSDAGRRAIFSIFFGLTFSPVVDESVIAFVEQILGVRETKSELSRVPQVSMAN